MTPLVVLALPLAIAVWGYVRLREQRAFLDYRRAKYQEQAEATARQSHEVQAALTARIDKLELMLGAGLGDLEAKFKRLEQGRELVRKAG